MALTQEDNLLIQTYFTTAFLAELNNNNFLQSNCYKELQFKDNYVKDNFPSIGIGNQGNLLITLYTLLVIPKQLLSNEFPDKFSELNTKIKSIQSKTESNYKSDEVNVDYLRHIRNAVAHARVEFIPNVSVTFHDKDDRKNEQCAITIPLSKVGLLLTDLQLLFMTYIEKLKTKQ